MSVFKIHQEFEPAGDQPKAIKELVEGIKKGYRYQTLLGVTGSGKTFTVANVIAKINKPTLVIAHNKTLAAQLAQEYREFFPNNAVHYFVSYYDFYQPEAYMPVTDTYIEKEAMINEEIERLRHASTQALLTRPDVIIVASVSCIYGLGNPEEYEKVNLKLQFAQYVSRSDLIRDLISIHFTRTNADVNPGTFRALGNAVELMPVSERIIYRIEINNERIQKIIKIDPVSRVVIRELEVLYLFPAKHFITSDDDAKRALLSIKQELNEQLVKLNKEGKLLEAERLKRRTTYDLAMIREVGYTNGIENYSRHFSGKSAGEAPYTLLDYFPKKSDGSPDFLTIIDESHVAVPQIGGMYAGDKSRKDVLIEHGFRLPSARDNRPLRFEEFEDRVGRIIFTSATPAKYEKEKSLKVVEQVIRPTGLVDPEVAVRPIQSKGNYKGQVHNFITEAGRAIEKGGRVIATTLTKKMAEDLSEFLKDQKINARYLHSEIKTIERIEILTAFRRGEFDCLVGVNLLREGLDLPEVTLIGILDADKEGFLRSDTSLIQIIGRAARNVEGRVILYADTVTGSMERAIDETARRRKIQTEYNKKHGITPKTIIKKIKDITDTLECEHRSAVNLLLETDGKLFAKNPKKLIKMKKREMEEVVRDLDFESAAILRDEIRELEKRL
ncbi:MAG: excinuclease ABC subunit B [Candidatus Zambryskibacteria bacterium RIFCSPLOWO2_01_FULL_42_41]|nr:MAG: excinuclease ABC subunit B [Candidatus Zambryskibacteria bacterium RIFCSPHIGHO2_01_FULL_43_60]OHB02820.1 MAG: excinuclease ABC subunit B [Candidatus Zambryskibacteria bacterium RIFCSPLOWO2_01_FULL_42_41]